LKLDVPRQRVTIIWGQFHIPSLKKEFIYPR